MFKFFERKNSAKVLALVLAGVIVSIFAFNASLTKTQARNKEINKVVSIANTKEGIKRSNKGNENTIDDRASSSIASNDDISNVLKSFYKSNGDKGVEELTMYLIKKIPSPIKKIYEMKLDIKLEIDVPKAIMSIVNSQEDSMKILLDLVDGDKKIANRVAKEVVKAIAHLQNTK